jgi:Peptidase of plants and bacteria
VDLYTYITMHIVDKHNDRPDDELKRDSEHPNFSSSSKEIPAVHIDITQLVPIHLQIHPVTHVGAKTFTNNFPDIGAVLENAVHTCWHLLYNNESHLLPENVRSITLFVRSIPGVAYTTGNWLDGDNKEIHLSVEYVRDQSPARTRDEIRGVIVHEMVHVWQNDGTFFPHAIDYRLRNRTFGFD